MSKNRGKRDHVMYQQLQECSELETDPFWKELYMDLALGKNTNNLFVSQDGCVVYKIKSKLNYPLEGKTVQEICSQLKPILIRFTNLSSEADMTEMRQLFASEAKTFSDKSVQSWSSVKKKGLKDMMLIDFVIGEKHSKNLSTRESTALLDLLKKLFLMKAVHSNDVQIEDNKIVSIKNLDYDVEQRSFWHPSMDDTVLQISRTATAGDSDSSLQDKWRKYLDTIVKHALIKS